MCEERAKSRALRRSRASVEAAELASLHEGLTSCGLQFVGASPPHLAPGQSRLREAPSPHPVSDESEKRGGDRGARPNGQAEAAVPRPAAVSTELAASRVVVPASFSAL